MTKKYIRLENLIIINKKKIFYKISYSASLKKFFSNQIMYVEYDQEINHLNKSILYIPAVGALIHLAWVMDADLFVNELDYSFFYSLLSIKSVLKSWFPKIKFNSNIIVEKLVINRSNTSKSALLFSGGIDSLASYIKHRKEIPILVTIWGADISPRNKKAWSLVEKNNLFFSEKEKLEFYIIKTNFRETLNEPLLDALVGRYTLDHGWWGGFSHGIQILGLCAPISVNRFSILYIASSQTNQGNRYPWGSDILTDSLLTWNDIKVVHDGISLSRQDKIKIISNFINETNFYPQIKVCWKKSDKFNCGLCEKCFRTIIGLILEGINPNKCGFTVNSMSFDFLKTAICAKKYPSDPINKKFWKSLQHSARYGIFPPKYEDFFNWFINFDFDKCAKVNFFKSPFFFNFKKSGELLIYRLLPSIILKKIREKRY